MQRIRLAGVPEQVNLPIRICLDEGIFQRYGVDVEYRVVPEGTGKLMELVESGEVDIAIMVADGFIAGRANGRKVNLYGTYVSSPLVWAVAGLPGPTAIEDLNQISEFNATKQFKYGISRRGSGSHTMAFYTNMKHGLGALNDESSFVVANNFQGLRKGVTDTVFDAFLWETFTTKPFFDSGELHKIGEVSTPWPAFLFVGATKSAAAMRLHGTIDFSQTVRTRLFPALRDGIEIFRGEHGRSVNISIERICSEFNFKPEDAREWLSKCRYNIPTTTVEETAGRDSDRLFAVNETVFADAVRVMQQAGLVGVDFSSAMLWDENDVISFCGVALASNAAE